MARRLKIGLLCVILGFLLLTGCTAEPVLERVKVPSFPTARLITPSPIPEEPTLQIETSTSFPAPTNTTVPAGTPKTCDFSYTIMPGHFLLSRPIGLDDNQLVDYTYRYGSTANGQYEIHHGVEFHNPTGTPVLAAAEGVVVAAGQDDEVAYAQYKNFYGNLVILEHSFPDTDEPVYTLYGHLSQVSVEVGDVVQRGQVIGKVGAAGVALGSHLHFEVRLGINDYYANRNPELWLEPLPGTDTGALAGVLVDQNGLPLSVSNLVVKNIPPEGKTPLRNIYVETYGGDEVNGDDLWGEVFGLGDLPAGQYTLSFTYGKVYKLTVEIELGQLTLATFCVEDK
jgi:hypothetical protein